MSIWTYFSPSQQLTTSLIYLLDEADGGVAAPVIVRRTDF
jgi:hypothetical protein